MSSLPRSDGDPSSPIPSLSLEGLEGLVETLVKENDETKIFSHGDFHPLNILVDQSTGRKTGVIDWEGAGFSVPGRDYCETKSRARNVEWAKALDEIFDETDRAHFDRLHQLSRAMIRYTFV